MVTKKISRRKNARRVRRQNTRRVRRQNTRRVRKNTRRQNTRRNKKTSRDKIKGGRTLGKSVNKHLKVFGNKKWASFKNLSPRKSPKDKVVDWLYKDQRGWGDGLQGALANEPELKQHLEDMPDQELHNMALLSPSISKKLVRDFHQDIIDDENVQYFEGELDRARLKHVKEVANEEATSGHRSEESALLASDAAVLPRSLHVQEKDALRANKGQFFTLETPPEVDAENTSKSSD